MTAAREVIAAVLVVAAALVALVCAIGVWRIDDDLPRVHAQSPLTAFCIPLVAIAIAIDVPWTPSMAKALLLGVVSLVVTPVVTHAVARAAHHRAEGRTPARPEVRDTHEADEARPLPPPESPAP